MSDEPDFIERVEKTHERWTGEQWAPEKTIETFSLYGKAKRIEALEQLDGAVNATNPTTGNLRRYSMLTGLRRDLEAMHQLMIREGK
jgi:hypothetical protein